MASCSRSQFSPRHVQVYYKPRYLFSNNFYSSRLLNFQILSYSENVIPLKISSYSVTFVSKDCAFILSCRQNTEPKRLVSKNIRVSLERTPH